MNAALKIFTVGGSSNCANWMKGVYCYHLDRADVVVFPGGADVNPMLYGRPVHPKTKHDILLDAKDLSDFVKARDSGKRMIGICRGAQFLCANAGGILVQDQSNIAFRHPIMTYDGKIITVSSEHHQAMFPWRMPAVDYRVLGWSLGQSKYHQDGDLSEMVNGLVPLNMEVEIAFFPKIKALGIQAHPEWQYATRATDRDNHDTIEYMRELFERFVDGDTFSNAHDSFQDPPPIAATTAKQEVIQLTV